MSAKDHKDLGGRGVSRVTGMSSAHLGSAGPRATSQWSPSRPSGLPGSARRGHRQSNMHRSTSSRMTGDNIDAVFPFKVLDEQGMNRTPKPLVAIVTSAALRQARGIATEDSVVVSEPSDANFGDMLSGGFSRAWFDSGTQTPQEASVADLDYQSARLMAQASVAIPASLAEERSLLGIGGGSSAGGCISQITNESASASGSARPTGTPRAAAAVPAAAVVLSDDNLAKPQRVLLQETKTMFMWEAPGKAGYYASSVGLQSDMFRNTGMPFHASCAGCAIALGLSGHFSSNTVVLSIEQWCQHKLTRRVHSIDTA
eukprot:GHRR01019446.1.p1 GENE.GHRR01019446.1~~GHRR01019446.1.p1  ORF type:complete len:315 (+),score=69.47 GHRR01019446.1:2383-3327(+)